MYKEALNIAVPVMGNDSTYSGAIGMTFLGGGGYGGLSITTPEGDPLTLKDRLTHHYTTGMSTIEISSQDIRR